MEVVKPRVKTIVVDRSQTRWAEFDLESLIDEHHAARTTWELSGRFDLRRFEEQHTSCRFMRADTASSGGFSRPVRFAARPA